MLISLNWIRDFVDLPAAFDPPAVAERFTIVCAEVEDVRPVRVNAQGLIAARVITAEAIPDTPNLTQVTLDVGGSGTVQTVTAAAGLSPGMTVVYAPVGASVADTGEIRESKVAGRTSNGMILPGEALGIPLAMQEAIRLASDQPEYAPGAVLPPELFDDWVIEVDNKSITHRPDLWGLYGVARELAAIYGTKLKPYPVTELAELSNAKLPEIPIEIDDPALCRRYSGLLFKSVESRPAPLWMQLRLGHVGLRPIDCLVDLTNYIMVELGQPMHAFDGDRVDRIEVGLAKPGSKFKTLDGVDRTMPPGALMINANRKPIALAGVMGGAETEIGPKTQSMLLESANFDPAVIRRCAATLGHRTDASARFEKSLDPANTVLAIQRFVQLARQEWPAMELASRLSDCYPNPAEAITVRIDPEFVNRTLGQPITRAELTRILTALEFTVRDCGAEMEIGVPSFRATKDVAIQADIIEEIARYVGYDNITPVLPEVTVRSFAPNALHELEQNTLRAWCGGLGYSEVHGYLWYDAKWCRQIEFDPGECIELRNPIGEGMERMRATLLPGLLAAFDRNRHHFSEFKLIEVGTVFGKPGTEPDQRRCFGALWATRRKDADDVMLSELRGHIETWAWQVLGRGANFSRAQCDAARLWEHAYRTGVVRLADIECGRFGVIPLPLRKAIDARLAGWSIVWAEVELDALSMLEPPVVMLEDIPQFPQKDMDFTVQVPGERDYAEVSEALSRFEHPLLQRISFVTSFEGKIAETGKRSLTFRTRLAACDRTLVEEELTAFSQSFQEHLGACGLELVAS